eukprot:g5111.t1
MEDDSAVSFLGTAGAGAPVADSSSLVSPGNTKREQFISNERIVRIIEQVDDGSSSTTQRDYDFRRVRDVLEAPFHQKDGKQVIVPNLYTRGLAARALAFLMEANARYATIIRSSPIAVDGIVRTLNRASAIGRSMPSHHDSLTVADASRIALNCAGALATAYTAAGRTSHYRLDIRSEGMQLHAVPTMPELPLSYLQQEHEMLQHHRLQMQSRDGSSSLLLSTHRQQLYSRDGMEARRPPSSLYGSGNSSLHEQHSRPASSAVAAMFPVTAELDSSNFFRPETPIHRPLTQFSNAAAQMGLYDEAHRSQLDELWAERERQEKALEDGLARASDDAMQDSGEGSDGQRLSYTAVARGMLQTPMPMQGSAGLSLSRQRSRQRRRDISHSLRRNFTAIPAYLEALGLLKQKRYPMLSDVHTDSSNAVQRSKEKIVRRESAPAKAWAASRSHAANTGVLLGPDPDGMGSDPLLQHPKTLGYVVPMMWYPQPRLQLRRRPNPVAPASPQYSVLHQHWQERIGSSSSNNNNNNNNDNNNNNNNNNSSSINSNSVKSPGGAIILTPSVNPTAAQNDADKCDLDAMRSESALSAVPPPTRIPTAAEDRSVEVIRLFDPDAANAIESSDGNILTARAHSIVQQRVANAPAEIEALDRIISRTRASQLDIAASLHNRIDRLRFDLPLKFLLQLKSDGGGGFSEIDVNIVRERAYLMLVAWAEEIRLRKLAAALVPWWQLVVRCRAREYRAGVGVRLLCGTITRKIMENQRRRLRRWLRATAWLRHEERDEAARSLQRAYRGYLGRLEYLEVLRRHLAAIPIQTRWRMISQRQKYHRARYLIILLQAHIRGFIKRVWYKKMHDAATLIESVARMRAQRKLYLLMAESICLVQTTYRAWLARQLFYAMVERRIRAFELRITATLIIQRAWRGHAARVVIWKVQQHNMRRVEAAVTIQRWWYNVNDEFSTFLLMRLYALQDEQEQEAEKRRYRLKRIRACLLLQGRVRRWVKARRAKERAFMDAAAARMQRRWRGLSTRRAMLRFRADRKAAIAIQRGYRKARWRRVQASFVILRFWFYSPSGIAVSAKKGRRSLPRVRAHLISVKKARAEAALEEKRRREYIAARCLQTCCRSRLARLHVRKIFAAIRLEAFARMSLAKILRARLFFAHCSEVALSFVPPLTKEARFRALAGIQRRWRTAATVIQARARQWLARRRADTMRRDRKMRRDAAILLQRNFRHYRSRLQHAKIHELKECARLNVFQSSVSANAVLGEVYDSAADLFDPNDEIVGMGIATLLLRLGLGRHALSVEKYLHKTKAHAAVEKHDNTGAEKAQEGKERQQEQEQELEQEGTRKKPKWLRCRSELGRLSQLRTLLADDSSAKDLRRIFSDESPAAIERREAEAEGRPVRRRRVGKKILDPEKAYGVECLQRVRALLIDGSDDAKENAATLVHSKATYDVAYKIYKDAYPGNPKRARRFAGKVQPGTTSRAQLASFLSTFGERGGNIATERVEQLSKPVWEGWMPSGGKGLDHKPGFNRTEKAWNAVRIRRCFELYQMAVEKISAILNEGTLLEDAQAALRNVRRTWHWRRPQVQDSDLLYPCPLKPPQEKQLRAGTKWLGRLLEHFKKTNAAALMVQRVFRGRVAFLLYRATVARRKIEAATKAYLEERAHVLNGDAVREQAAKDRKREEEERKEWEKEVKRQERLSVLATTLRTGWREDFDEES